MKNIKNIKVICNNCIYILSICLLIYNVLFFFTHSIFSNEYELSVTSKNENKIHSILSKKYEDTEKITKLKLQPLLGEANLYLYTNWKLSAVHTIGEGDEIMNYILEYGNNTGEKYILYILLSLILMLVTKSYREKNIS